MRIRLLDERTIRQIAAGEVVERPASVVKELVENCLDAGAKAISVRLSDGGREGIVVVDDGCGMDGTDLPLAFERHATSKITTFDDLQRCSSFGFRGEALPSIAAVATVRCVSRPHDASGAQEVVVGPDGVNAGPRPAAGERGTTIEVQQIFAHTPVRRKGLRSPQAERARCLAVLQEAALVHETVHFRLLEGEKELLNVPPHRSAKELLPLLFGPNVAAAMVPLAASRGTLAVRGWLVPPAHCKGRTQLHIVINRRPVSDRALLRAVTEGYRPLLERGRYPAGVLFVTLPPQEVDCNVHPAKSEVRLNRHQQVVGSIVLLVREALAQADLVPSYAFPAPAAAPSKTYALPRARFFGPSEPMEALQPDAQGRIHWEGLGGPLGQTQVTLAAHQAVFEPEGPAVPSVATVERPKDGAPGLPLRVRILGQVNRTYLLGETDGGVVLIDQHAAHEKVTFERLLRHTSTAPLPDQRLLSPLLLHTDAAVAAAVHEHLTPLRHLGFEVEPFGPTTFRIHSMPAILEGMLASEDVLVVVQELATLGRSELSVQQLHEVLHERACRSSVRGGDPLELPQARRLVEELFAAKAPYTCPHGRPTILTLGFDELERQFGRKGR